MNKYYLPKNEVLDAEDFPSNHEHIRFSVKSFNGIIQYTDITENYAFRK